MKQPKVDQRRRCGLRLIAVVCAVFAIVVALSNTALAGDTWYWDFSAAGDCSTPATAGDWSNVNCWTNASGMHPSVAPSTSGDDVMFQAKAANAGVVYVKLTRDIELKTLKSDVDKSAASLTSANRVIIFGDHQIYLSVSAGVSPCTSSIEYFCGFKMLSGYLLTTFLCGPVDPSSSLVLDSSKLEYRLDRFALAAGEDRSSSVNVASPSYGHYSVCAPAGSAIDVTGTWQLTAGSPFASRVSPDAHVLSAGTIVTASDDSLPAGTFVKRIFDDATIELSASANNKATVGGSTLTFAAFSTKMRQTLGTFRRQNTEASYRGPQLIMTSPDDDARLTIVNLGGSDSAASRYFGFDTASGYPGTIAISNAYWKGYMIELANCHLEFDPPSVYGEKAGFPAARQIDVASGKTATVTIPEGVSAEFSYLSSVSGTLVKDGAGSLTVASTNTIANKYTGSIIVKEGTLAFTDGSVIPALTAKSGATLRLFGEADGANVTMEAGSTLSGGTLVVDSAVGIPTGVIYLDGASVRVRGGSGEVLTELPTAEIAPNPAFWVDFSNPDCYVADASDYVTLIKDVRGDGYMTAAPAGDLCPVYVANESAGGAVGSLRIDLVNSVTAIADSRDPLWSRQLTNIRAVYMVHYVDASHGGGQLLGWSGGGNGDFMRPAREKFTSSLFYEPTLPDKVKNAPLYHNGRLTSYAQGYPYMMTSSGPDGRKTPIVTELHTLGDCKSDSFAHNSGSTERNGGQIICECIVYTNELTESQRLATRTMLMRKWLNCEPFWTRGATTNSLGAIDDDMAVSAEAGETLYADIMESGTLVKHGAGSLYINDVRAPDGVLAIAGGSVTIRSDALTVDSLPGNAHAHLDASALETLTTNVVDGKTEVSSWKDRRAGETLTANVNGSSTNRPTLIAAAGLGGKWVVDYGPYFSASSDSDRNTGSSHMQFSKSSRRGHTVIGLYGTENGGGQVVGAYNAGYNDGWGVFRGVGMGADASDPLVSTQPGTFANSGSIIVSNSVVATVNGRRIDAFREGFTGGWDIFSIHVWPERGLQGVGGGHYGHYSGGQSIAELIEYPHGLSNVEIERVEAYLAKKWKGTETVGYREAVLDTVSVAAGSTLTVEGDGRLTVNKMSGGGIVNGAVTLAANAVLEVVVADDGNVETMTVDDVDISNGGTVRLVGNISALSRGVMHNLIVSPSISQDVEVNWTVVSQESPKGVFVLRAVDGALQLKVMPPGMAIVFR